MKQQKINGITFAEMITKGAKNLSKHVKQVNALNVFPVPDGDTGTNMNLSLTSGVKEMNKTISADIGTVAKSLSRGLLMGARGNSGVILSQLFRGFAKYVEDKDHIDVHGFAQAFQHGVDMAYKAVMKPVEGTILTVAKDAAKVAKKVSYQTADITEVMDAICQEANASLARTPDLLSVLKEVGVVDSGGQGLVYIYQGFLSALTGQTVIPDAEQMPVVQEESISTERTYTGSENKEDHVQNEVAEMMAQGVLSIEDIKFGYCTEFMIHLHSKGKDQYSEDTFRESIGRFGDSLLVIADEELVKVHIHTEELDKVMEVAQTYGDLSHIKIENMRQQFLEIQNSTSIKESSLQKSSITEVESTSLTDQKDIALITVAMGEGIVDIFKSLGADVVINGGQTMNPSTKDFVNAIQHVQAKHVIILPNNSNIIMAAEQAEGLVDVPVSVIPTKNIAQGMAALLSFHPSSSWEENTSLMTDAKNEIKSGQVTHAVRDTEMEGMVIKKGEFMGILDGKIAVTDKELYNCAWKLCLEMIDDESEVLTLFYGEGLEEEDVQVLSTDIETYADDIEVEVHRGGQPLYPYLISVE